VPAPARQATKDKKNKKKPGKGKTKKDESPEAQQKQQLKDAVKDGKKAAELNVVPLTVPLEPPLPFNKNCKLQSSGCGRSGEEAYCGPRSEGEEQQLVGALQQPQISKR
jgi:hypothetical protein